MRCSARFHITAVFLAVGLVIMLSGSASAKEAPSYRFPDEAEIASQIQPLIDDGSYVGIVVGIVGPHGRKVYGFGKTNRYRGTRPSGDTVFPLASITKTFTGALLADFELRGIVRLDDSIAKYLPPGVMKPGTPLSRITLLDLATHTSGLPRTPRDPSRPPDNTLGGPVSVRQMYDFLSHYQPSNPPGEVFLYSNIGVALLGHILERASGKPYGRLVQERICRPLGMQSTKVTPTASMLRRMAQGYGRNMNPVKLKKFDAGKSSGGLYSSANDMMDYLAANMGLVDAKIVPALLEAQRPFRQVPGKENAFMGLTWHVKKEGNREFVSKNGGLAGYQTFIMFSKTDKIGIVALANSSPKPRKIDAKARQILLRLIPHSGN